MQCSHSASLTAHHVRQPLFGLQGGQHISQMRKAPSPKRMAAYNERQQPFKLREVGEGVCCGLVVLGNDESITTGRRNKAHGDFPQTNRGWAVVDREIPRKGFPRSLSDTAHMHRYSYGLI
jgi:hypothetical protein